MTLAALQSRLQVIATAEPLLTGRPVFIEEKDNLVTMVQAALVKQSLCITIAPAVGEVAGAAPPARAAWHESLEVTVSRGLLDEGDVPSTVAVLDALRARIHGAPLDADRKSAGFFACRRHELRKLSDGTYVRVLTVGATLPVSSSAQT